MDFSSSAVEQDPFGADADARYVYVNARQEELLVALTSAIADGRTRLLVTGGEGSGKSSFLWKLAEVLYTTCDTALLGHEMVFSCQRDTSLEALESAMLEHAVLREDESENAQAAVLLLDDADRLDPAVLASLWRRWPSLNLGWSSISVVMSAMPPPKRLHGRSEHDSMAAEQTFELPPMALADVESLIRHRLQVAGLSGVQLFTPDAVERIAYFSKRVPGRIVQLCGSIVGRLGRELSAPVSGDDVKDVAYNLFLPGHLQKLARGLAPQPKPLRGTGTIKAPGGPDTLSGGRQGAAGDDAAASDDARSRTEISGGGDGITMPPSPPEPPARAGSAAARAPQRRRQLRRLPMGARSLAAAAAVLLLIVATVVAVSVRQSHQLARTPFEAVLASPDDQTERVPGAGQDGIAGPGEPPGTESDGSASPAVSATDTPDMMSNGARSEGPRSETALTDFAQPPEPARSVDRPVDRPVERSGRADAAGADGASRPAVGDAIADQPIAQVEPRRPPPLAELNDVALVQSQLNALGYAAGPVDGIAGPRTRAAIRRFQAATGLPIDGRMSETLIASLRRQAAKSNLQNQGRERLRRRIMPAIRGQLDSLESPQEFLQYCRDNQDTWVFDRGTGKFVFCAQVVENL